ncbi:MAG: hypothetical protein ACE367_14610 [Acidimicrobiales bacterium]
MSDTTISTIALLLCLAPGVLHAAEVAFPLLARWIVNYVLPFFGPALPAKAGSLANDEQLAMLDAAVDAAPAAKKEAAADYVFLMLFEQRQGSLAFLSVIAGVIYALTLTLTERNPLHLVLVVMAALFALVNLNHAGIPFLGHHPRVTRHGRNVGIVFGPFWALAAVLNALAFSSSLPA